MSSPVSIKERLEVLLNAFETSRRFATLYPDNHPKLKESVDNLRDTINGFAEDRSAIKLTLYKQECFLDEVPPEEKFDIPWGLADRFLRLGLASIILPKDISVDELIRLLRFLSIDSRKLRSKPNLDDLAQQFGLRTVSLAALDYGKLFSEGIGHAAHSGDRDEEHFARLLTLWDPRRLQREMSAEEVEALGRLSNDKSAMSRLIELSLKGSHPDGSSGPLVEGTVGALDRLSERLKVLYPERWDSVRSMLVRATLSLDSDLLLRQRPELLQKKIKDTEAEVTIADSMDNVSLADAITDAFMEQDTLNDSLSGVLHDLIPKKSRREELTESISKTLRNRGIPSSQQVRIISWWEESVIPDTITHESLDPLFSSLLNASSSMTLEGDEEFRHVFQESMTESGIDAVFFDDLRGMLGVHEEETDLDLILGSYQAEFKRLMERGQIESLKQILEELCTELERLDLDISEKLSPLLGIALVDSLSSLAIGEDPEKRSLTLEIARLFGDNGFRVVMNAISLTNSWELLEELRNEIRYYDDSATDEILEWLKHPDVRMIKEALILLRSSRRTDIISKINPLQRHSEPEIRATALTTLMRVGGAEQLHAVSIGLNDSNARVVTIALELAEEFGIHHFSGQLSELLRTRRDDTSFLGPRRRAIRLVGENRLVDLKDDLKDIIQGVGSWLRYTRDEELLVPAARALLDLEDSEARAFVRHRARWSIGNVRKACTQAIREER